MRRKERLSFQALVRNEKEKILNNPEELDKIYDKIEQRMELVRNPKKHA
ncbi:FbpB family small basic protein [Alkalibacillus silvisoli]|uniref:FbpB family small basic protein n=1 Tax=Alkalibacillus silvisoli TaxID=392823 RepID=A0ABN0ZY03_9BACI